MPLAIETHGLREGVPVGRVFVALRDRDLRVARRLTPTALHMPLGAVIAGLLAPTVLFTALALNRFLKRAR